MAESFLNTMVQLNHMAVVDESDKKIIDVLRVNSRLSNRQIAKETGIPMATVNRRIKKMVENRVIKRFTVDLDYGQLGKNTLAYVLLRTSYGADYYDIYDEAIKNEAVEEINSITGQFDVFMKLRVKDVDEFSDYLFQHVRNLPNIIQTETMLALKVKRTKKKKKG